MQADNVPIEVIDEKALTPPPVTELEEPITVRDRKHHCLFALGAVLSRKTDEPFGCVCAKPHLYR